MRDPALESMAATLEASGEYRVLRRLAPRPPVEAPRDLKLVTGLFVDVETTGLDPARDEIIELAMVPFTFSADGRIFAVGEAFDELREPSVPISAEVTAITGITAEMVAGRSIDPRAVAAFAEGAALVLAHNAAFDRRFLERFCDVFSGKYWACSMSQVNWTEEGHEGTKLAYLAHSLGFFYDRHRAIHDCMAALEILSRPLPVSGALALTRLLERARRPSWRIWAEDSPFEQKDALKARGYRWNGDGAPRAWYVDVDEDRRDAELAYLKTEIYRREVTLPIRRIDGRDRFSERC
jgi:DNA polymerase-3 subunit epsilon